MKHYRFWLKPIKSHNERAEKYICGKLLGLSTFNEKGFMIESCQGAFMFQYIEEPETEVISSMVSKRKEAVMRLWNITEKWVNFYLNWDCFKIFVCRYNTIHISNWSTEVVDVIENYQKQVIVEAQLGYDGKDIPGWIKIYF